MAVSQQASPRQMFGCHDSAKAPAQSAPARAVMQGPLCKDFSIFGHKIEFWVFPRTQITRYCPKLNEILNKCAQWGYPPTPEL